MDSYLAFQRDEAAERGRKTKVWSVLNAHSTALLGIVSWFACWRQYTFTPERLTVFSPGCLRDIADFCAERTEEHRRGRSATVEMIDYQGGKIAKVRLGQVLDVADERWFAEYLLRAEGLAFVEYDEKLRHLVGYGVYLHWWEQFRFWLAINIYERATPREEVVCP